MGPCDGMVMLMDDEMAPFWVLIAFVQLDPIFDWQPRYWVFWKWTNAFFKPFRNCTQVIGHLDLTCFDGSEAG